jgi:acetyl-CoA C-acetyltransferase
MLPNSTYRFSQKSKMSRVVILASTRTPLGAFLGSFSTVPAPALAGATIQNLLTKSGLSETQINSFFLGNVLSAGVGQNPAKQSAKAGGLPDSTSCVLVNQVCCSSLKALVFAIQGIKLGDSDVSIVVGAENMSLAPRLVTGSRKHAKFGKCRIEGPVDSTDSMLVDGLWDSFCDCHMGALADRLAQKSGLTREQCDAYVLRCFELGKQGWETGELDVFELNGVKEDQLLSKLIPEKVPQLRPCFVENGMLTAASSSALADGAA